MILSLLVLGVLCSGASVPLFTPLQLVRPNEHHTGFEVVSETVSRIMSLPVTRIAVVSVVGPYHSGKSFLLNALIGQTNVFSVGPKTSPETMGLWICRTNVTLPAYPDVEVWFVDSEGFFGPQIPESYDAKTFTLSMMLADEFVYNTVKIIDSQAVGMLEMLARRAQLFRVKSSAASGSSTTGVQHRLERLPHLTWVVEDFVQSQDDSTSNTKWLESYLTAQGVDEPYLKKIFPELSVKSLFLPATSRQALSDLSKVPFAKLTPEFRSDLEGLRGSIINRLNEKKTDFISSSDFAQSLYFLAKALEKGLFPQIPSLWASWRTQVIDSSLADAVALFDQQLAERIDSHGSSDSIPSADVFNDVASNARKVSLVLYTELVRDFINDSESRVSLAELLPQLETEMDARHARSFSQYMESAKSFLREKLKVEFTKFLSEIPTVFDGKDLVEPEVLQRQLGKLAIARIEKFESLVTKFAPVSDTSADLPEKWQRAAFPQLKLHPVDELRGDLQTQIDSLLVENDKAILNVIKTSIVSSVKSVDDVLGSASTTLFSTKELDEFAQKIVAGAEARFEKEVGGPTNRQWMKSVAPHYESALKTIESEVKEKLGKFRSAHQDRLYEWFRKNSEKSINVYRDMKRTIEMSMLPCDEQVMDFEHGKAVAGLVHSLDEDLGGKKFNDTAPYRETRARLDELIHGEFGKLRNKNIELWKVHSDEATQCAYDLNVQYEDLHCPQGWFCWFKVLPRSHATKSREHLMDCFETSKRAASSAPPPSESIRQQIFDSWYEKELGREVAEVKSNMWIALVSLIVPIAWIVYIKHG